MALINWINDYSVGVAELDEQHKKLFALINELHQLYIEKKYDNTDVEPIFKKLFEYADYHFSTEEHYFQLFNYSKKQQHTDLHNSYRENINKFKANYDAENGEKTLFAINEFLNTWWIWHINNADKEYTAYFNANGVK